MRHPAAQAALATVLAAAFHLWGPPGGDQAAHLHLTELWRQHGWLFWDNLWYLGRYAQVNYSLLYYPLAATLGPVAVSALSGGLAAWAFGALSTCRWPWAGAWPGWTFAVLTPLPVIAGTYPFALGLAFGLASLLALSTGRTWVGLLAAALALLASPLALFFLLLAAVAALASRPRMLGEARARWAAAGLAGLLLAQLASMRAFPTPDAHYPFDPKDAVAVAAFSAVGMVLVWSNPAARDVRAFFAIYLLTLAAALAVPTSVGGNLVRVTLVAGVPLMVVAAMAAPRRVLPLAATACVAAAVWQLTPAWTGGRVAWDARASQATFWDPVVRFLHNHPDPDHRVHVVATADNWEAYYLPRAGVALTRGWFRQDDFPMNDALYKRPLTAGAYVAWLRQVGVRHVFVPHDPLDYTGHAEARLIATGGVLHKVTELDGWTVYSVPGDRPIVEPAAGARVIGIDPGTIRLRVSSPGEYRVKMRYSPYLAAGAGTCVAPAEPWGVRLRVDRPGEVDLRFAPSAGRVAREIAGRFRPCVPAR